MNDAGESEWWDQLRLPHLRTKEDNRLWAIGMEHVFGLPGFVLEAMPEDAAAPTGYGHLSVKGANVSMESLSPEMRLADGSFVIEPISD